MANSFKLRMLAPTAQNPVLEAASVIIPGKQGYMTILPEHAAMVSQLDIGHMQVREAGTSDDRHYFISGGFVEVSGEEVTVLADVLEEANAIDIDRAVAAKARAVSRLEGKGDEDELDVDRANLSLKRADVRSMIASTLAATAK